MFCILTWQNLTWLWQCVQSLRSCEWCAAFYPWAEWHTGISVMIYMEVPNGWQKFSLGEQDACRSTERMGRAALQQGEVWWLVMRVARWWPHLHRVRHFTAASPVSIHFLPIFLSKPLQLSWDDLHCEKICFPPLLFPPTLNEVTLAGATQTFHCITQGRHVFAWDCIIFPLEDLTRCEKSKCDYFQLQMIALVCGIACWCLLGIMVWLKTYCWSYDVSLFH